MAARAAEATEAEARVELRARQVEALAEVLAEQTMN